MFCQLRFEPTSSASSKASCNFLISRHSTASLKRCQVSVLYWKGSFKQAVKEYQQCRTKDLVVIYIWLIAHVHLQLGPLLCQPCTSLWPKLLLHGYHSFLSGSQMSVDDLSTTLNWFKRLVHLDRPRVAQGHRGAPSQIAQPPWLPLSGLVYGNNGSKVHFCFLSLLCSIILHAVLRAVRGTSRRFMASWRPLMIFIRFSSSSQWWEWEHLCKSWKYSAKHCKVVASMSSLVFLGCSKAVTSTHKNVVKTLKVWGILSDNLVHFGLRIAKHWQSPEPIQILHVFLFLYTPPTRGPFTMPLYFSHYTKEQVLLSLRPRWLGPIEKTHLRVPCQWFCLIQWSLWMSG